MAVSGVVWAVLLVARVLFGGVIAFTGIHHFQGTEEMVGYAQYKGLPAPKAGVLGSGVLLVLGGLSIVLGVFPAVGSFAVAIFLLVSALIFHDFWAVPDEEQADEMNHFLKNVALAGGALAFGVLSVTVWEPIAAVIQF
ncbi:DoxX family protein [Halocatena halophila]|uniref:DoxX family protein n=1 Tax=Halocatena halophila TaxID=2814576 RepID=UPI002ED0FFB2